GRRNEAVALSRIRVPPPVDGGAGDFDHPFERRPVGPLRRGVGKLHRFLEEAAVQLEYDRLRMRVPDIGVPMMNEVDFLDHGTPYLTPPAAMPRRKARWKMRNRMISGSTTSVDAMFIRCHCVSCVLL